VAPVPPCPDGEGEKAKGKDGGGWERLRRRPFELADLESIDKMSFYSKTIRLLFSLIERKSHSPKKKGGL